jgi:hypothetical protein
MQRAATTVVGFAVVVLTIWLVFRNFQPPQRIGHAPDAGADASPATAEDRAPMFALGNGIDGGSAVEEAGTLMIADLVAPGIALDGGGRGGVLPDGTPVPAMPVNAPRQVRFGVVLVSYAGAQQGPGAGRVSRSREDAKALATKLLATAQQDFHLAVQQGDAGSSDDVGRVKLGVLEPAPEYELFTMGVGQVAGPIDTPRGYWIVKRLE